MPWAPVRETFEKYNSLRKELPAMGYSAKQIKDLEATINRADCDIVISATPTNLRHLINANKPIVQVSYEIQPWATAGRRALRSSSKQRYMTRDGPVTQLGQSGWLLTSKPWVQIPPGPRGSVPE